jgi:hypothetical protein
MALGESDEGYEMEALGENHFRLLIEPVDLRFEVTRTDGPLQLIETGGGKPAVFEAVPPFTASTQELKEYASVYHSEEIDPLYKMRLEEDKLVLHRLKNEPDKLTPVTRDPFSAKVGYIRS